MFDLATNVFGVPKPMRLVGPDLLSRETVGFVWSERQVDAWVEATRTKLAQLRELVG